MAIANCVFGILLMASASLAASTMNQDKVKVTLYYESLCPDSIKFYTKQLYPTWVNLSNYMDLMLVPFGKATYNKTENGKFEFACHHGEAECVGNKVQACALKVLPKMTDQLGFIRCAMSMTEEGNRSTPYPGAQCASTVGIDYKPINDCMNTDQASMYLAEFGDKTSEFEANLKSVPTVVFNDKYSEENDKMAKMNFRSTLCGMISGTKPTECMEASGNNSAVTIRSGYVPFVAMSAIILTRLY